MSKKKVLAVLALAVSFGLVGCKSTIVLEDMHAGVFMAMENASFEFYEDHDGVVLVPEPVCSDTTTAKRWGRCDPDAYETEYRHGVLFQMGLQVAFGADDHGGDAEASTLSALSADPFKPVAITKPDTLPSILATLEEVERTEHSAFGGVYIKHSGGDEWLFPSENKIRDAILFDWLDVRETGSKCVIDPLGAYLMLVNETLDIDNGCPDPLTLSDPEYHCSRNRSIHADVEARALITYWPGPGSYEMKTGETDEKVIELPDGTTVPSSHGASHVSYRLLFSGKVVVDRWLLGCHQEQYTGVTEIRILFNEDSVFHLGYPHQPMNGKKE